MVYIKHPDHGNKHVNAEEAEKLTAEGWVIWPRSKEAKAGIVPALPPIEFPQIEPESVLGAPDAAPPVKRAYVRKAQQ